MQTTQALSGIQPGNYDIDPQCTAIRFRTRHMFGVGQVRGTFALRSGAVRVTDPADGSTVYAEIEAGSFATGNPQRDQTVLSPRFLDAQRYPVITFAAQRTDPAAGVINGTLTVRDVERRVSLAVTSVVADGPRVRVTATLPVDRLEFGLTAMRGLAGRYLNLELTATCVRRQGGGNG